MLSPVQKNVLLLNALFLVLFITLLGFYYRLVPEDYYAVSGNQHAGPWQQAIQVCNQWGGRFLSYLFSFLLLEAHEAGMSYAWYFMVCCGILLVSIHQIIRLLAQRKILSFHSQDHKALAGLFFLMLFYLTPGIQESWFWAAASPSYLGGLVMAMAGTAFMLSVKPSWLSVLGASVCFFYTCSASEPFALMVLFFLFLILIFRLFKKRHTELLSILFIFFAALAGFLLMYTAKGTADRWLAMPDLDRMTKLTRWAGAAAKYFLFWFPQTLAASLVFAPLLLLNKGMLQVIPIANSQNSFARQLFMLFAGYVFILALSFLPSCYVMGEAGPLRSWHHIGLYQVVFFSLLYLLLAKVSPALNQLLKKKLNLVLGLITVLHFSYIVYQVNLAHHYASAVDARMIRIEMLKNNAFTGTARLQKLPSSGYLFPAEISSDSSAASNTFLKNGLQLPFDIALETTVGHTP